MAKFRDYPSIPNTSSKWRTKPGDEDLFRKVDWVVTEKIHGANFSFIITADKNVRCAKRTAIIEDDESFFQWRTIQARYEEKSVAVFDKMSEKVSNLVQVHIFGEMFGGSYDHPEVPKGKSKPVQKGVQYSPEIDFLAFDLAYQDRSSDVSQNGDKEEDCSDSEERLAIKFADWDDFKEIMNECGMPSSDILYRGPMNEALHYQNRFQTTIPARFGLPEIENNIAEGIVVRPAKEILISGGQVRCLVKKKVPEFAESGGQSKSGNPSVRDLVKNDKLQNIDYEIQARVTENRLDATISKIGPIEVGKNFKKIMDFFTEDVLKDVKDEVEEMWVGLDEDEKKVCKKSAEKYCRTMILIRKQQEKI